jgi:hypothetical protein
MYGRLNHGSCKVMIHRCNQGCGRRNISLLLTRIVGLGHWCFGRLPVVDVKVTLIDGSYHDVDSSEIAFKIAGSMGFKEGFQASPVLWNRSCRWRLWSPKIIWEKFGSNPERTHNGDGDGRGLGVVGAMVPLQMFGY